jgi:hypothetical protein
MWTYDESALVLDSDIAPGAGPPGTSALGGVALLSGGTANATNWCLGPCTWSAGFFIRAGWGPVVATSQAISLQSIVPQGAGVLEPMVALGYTTRVHEWLLRASLALGGRYVWTNAYFAYGETRAGGADRSWGAFALHPALTASYHFAPSVGVMFSLQGDAAPPFEIGLSVGIWLDAEPYSRLPP